MKSRCNFRLTSFAKTLITSFWRKTKKITYAMSSSSAWANIAQGNYLCNVGPWLTNNFCEENNLYNVVPTMLGQHCIRIVSSQCCPNTSFQIKTESHLNRNWTIWATWSRIVTYSRLIKDLYLSLKWRLMWSLKPKNHLKYA